MADDIVARLRTLTDTLLLGNFQGLAATTASASDEIERLREALRVEQEELAACCIDRKETQRERDEARLLWCVEIGELYSSSPLSLAKERGWDCFKENMP